MTMRALILAVFACACEAFIITAGVKRSPSIPMSRVSETRAMAPDVTLAPVNLPTSVMIADDSSLLLASGGLIFSLFLFAVVGTVVINFGIRKK